MENKFTTQFFIKKAKEIHGDKFDYSEVQYKNMKEKIKIKCPKDHIFLQTAECHLRGSGCNICWKQKENALARGKKKIIPKEEFIKRAKIVHGDKINYNLTKYTCMTEFVELTCHKGHVFTQTPSSHIAGNGCSACARNKRFTQSQFLELSFNRHGNRFGYELSKYKSMCSNIIIMCHEHGLFITTPYNHIKRIGCNKCEAIEKTRKYYNSYIKFLNKAYEIHSDLYEYDLVEFVNTQTPIKIRCKKNHIFQQTPKMHVKGSGCPICKGGIRYTKEKILQMFFEVHKTLYEYPDFEYKNIETPIPIICKKHGVFKQKPVVHFHGNGCKKCSAKSSKMEKEWLDNIEKQYNIKLSRQYRIPGTNLHVDGFDEITKTVYEFHGDYWHGNPKLYDLNKINVSNGRSFEELYNTTIDRENKLKQLGYNLIIMWESDYYEIKSK